MNVLSFIVTLVPVLYIVAMFRALWAMEDKPIPQLRIPFLHLIDEPEEAAVVFIILGIVIAIAGYAFLYGIGTLRDVVGDFYANIAMEFVSVAITVLIIERLYERRSKVVAEKEEKERLILQMGSPNNGFVIEAVRQLEKRGWLKDGALHGADLMYANLFQTKLDSANLSYANLYKADLREADLKYANLTYCQCYAADFSKTDLGNANFQEAFLFKANFQNAYGLFVRFDDANLESAKLQGANLGLAKLTGTQLRFAKYSSNTIFPEGFDPVAAGAIFVEEDADE